MISIAASVLGLLSPSVPLVHPMVTAPEHARAKLIAEKNGVAPGGTIWVGLRFEMDEHWHIYWDGQNDSGMPVKGKWTQSEGVKMGEIQWPAPKRGVYPLDVIDYIYDNEVTAVVPVTVPKDVAIGSKVTLSGSLTWLVCSEQCLPGKGEVSIEIPVIAESGVSNSSDAKYFAETRKRLPKSALVKVTGGTNVERAGATEADLAGTWEGNTLVMKVEGAKGMVFYPDAACSTMTNAIKQGESKTGELRLSLEPKEGVPLKASGIVEIRYAEPRKAEFYSIAVLKAGLTGKP